MSADLHNWRLLFLLLLLRLEREAQRFQELQSFFIGSGGRNDRDFETVDFLNVVGVDFREYGIFLDSKGIVAMSVKTVKRDSPEIADARECDMDQFLYEIVHLLSPDGHGNPDRLIFLDLEVGNGLAGFGYHRPLPGNGSQSVEHLGLILFTGQE